MTDFRVIKENDLFLLTAADGDIDPASMHGHGLYKSDTRFLSAMTLLINGEKPILLSSEADQNYLSRIVLTNPHQMRDGQVSCGGNRWRWSEPGLSIMTFCMKK